MPKAFGNTTGMSMLGEHQPMEKYTATVSGTDIAGNVYTGTDSITFTVDNTIPTVVLTDTDSDNLLSGSQLVTITATFSEEIKTTPDTTNFFIDGGNSPRANTMTQITTNTYAFLWDTSIVGTIPPIQLTPVILSLLETFPRRKLYHYGDCF